MLRLLVLLLVLANAGFWAWSQGLLAHYGFGPSVQSEPQRLASQVRPEAIQLLPADEARRLENGGVATHASAPAAEAFATGCLQAGVFNEQQSASLRNRLEAALPAGSWRLETSNESARWIVYMGKYNNPETLAKKRDELRQLGLPFRAVNNAALAPGLALATFSLQADADTELARVTNKGVRSAKVVQERAETRGQILKLAVVDSALRARLDAITPQLEGKPLQPCS